MTYRFKRFVKFILLGKFYVGVVWTKINNIMLRTGGRDLRKPTDIFVDLNRFKSFEKRKGNFDSALIYPTSNDVINFDREIVSSRPSIFLGIGNLNSLDLIAHLSNPQELFFIDINNSQLTYLAFIIDLIKYSETRSHFIANFFGKNIDGVKRFLNNLEKEKNYDLLEDRFWNISSYKPKIISNIHRQVLLYDVVKKEERNIGIIYHTLGKNVIGGVNIIVSIFASGGDTQNGVSYHKFPLIKDRGFLFDEDLYRRIRTMLKNTPCHLICSELSADSLSAIAGNFPYHSLVLWSSNISSEYFFNTKIRDFFDKVIFLKFFQKHFYDIHLYEDERSDFLGNLSRKYIVRNPDPHWYAFSKILPLLGKRNIEVVSVEKWMLYDSTLPHTKKIFYKDAKPYLENEEIDCLFLHSLLSHGMNIDEYKKLVNQSISSKQKTILLEFNKNSKEISKNTPSVSIDELKKYFGEPSSSYLVPGYNCQDRNIIMVYNGNNL